MHIVLMPRVTVSVSDADEALIKEKGGPDGEYESQSAFVRECINRYEQVPELEARVNDLENQLRAVNTRSDDVSDLADYVSRERQLQRETRQRRRASLPKRLKWVLFGGGPE